MTARLAWILAIVGLLGGNVVAMVVLAVVANNGSAQVIPDYYARATHYDDELARSTASRALGWRVAVATQGDTLEATVIDASGAALDGARVRVTGYQRAHASDALDVALAPAGGGRYRAAFTARGGRYDLIVAVEAGGGRFTQHVVVEVP